MLAAGRGDGLAGNGAEGTVSGGVGTVEVVWGTPDGLGSGYEGYARQLDLYKRLPGCQLRHR